MKAVGMKRYAAAAFGLAMALSMLSGCGGSGSDKPESGQKTSGEVKVDSVKSALKFEVNENLDLGKKKLLISAWGEPAKEGQNAYTDRRYALERRTEEKYNVDIEWIAANTSTFTQDVTLAFTSGKKFADLMFCPSYYGYEIAQIGAISPLDDYINYDSPVYKMTGNNLVYVDGKHYSYMPDELSVNNLGFFMIYNETLLEKAGAENPLALYEQGKWDWDALSAIVEKTTVRTDGEIKQFGIGGSNLLDALCLSNGFSPISIKDGKFECGLYTTAGMNTLNFLKKLTYELKGVDGQYGGHNSKITFGDSKTALLVSPAYYPASFVSDGMPIGSVPMPKGPDAKAFVNGLEMQEWWTVSQVSDFSKEELLQVALDMNENDPAYEDTYYSEEGKKENFVVRLYDSRVFTTEEEAEFFYDFITDSKVENILNISTANMKSVFSQNIYKPISNGEEPRTVLERVKPVINEALKTMLPDKLK